jgi:hypothetical protein
LIKSTFRNRKEDGRFFFGRPLIKKGRFPLVAFAELCFSTILLKEVKDCKTSNK